MDTRLLRLTAPRAPRVSVVVGFRQKWEHVLRGKRLAGRLQQTRACSQGKMQILAELPCFEVDGGGRRGWSAVPVECRVEMAGGVENVLGKTPTQHQNGQ